MGPLSFSTSVIGGSNPLCPIRETWPLLFQFDMLSICYKIVMKSYIKTREKTIKLATANKKLEGLKVSAETRKIADSYIVEKASAKSAAAKIRARYCNL